ncbi:ROK family transcriptional regulator [Bacillus taeanensis]|uniref:ROK family transcriptional regulator n=1 Tax=Bacillus taeanensis TaxID=273032 RepID=A0A366XQF7_9BACI|nr:ROK family transcriptional regulator [Bacillus taeanensis]RBW68590.1 hypothetical protein DS031_15630 [Bacillus taeanensis]
MKPTPKSMGKVILSGIRRSLLELGSATKVELSEKLEISFPTISKFLAQMEKDGEILSAGLDESSGGRRAKRYTYNPEHMLGLAVFLEKNETNYTIFNCVGEVKEQGKDSSVLIEDGINVLTSFIEKIIASNSKIRSIAVGVPGSVDTGRIFFIPGYEQFQNVDLTGYYEKHFSIPVAVENDMNAAVLGYHYNKGIQDHQSLIYLYSGQNGPGAGIMINGDVVRGSTFFAGEVSFVPQYNDKNFGQVLEDGTLSDETQVDAISRLIASFAATINPHSIIFCKDKVDEVILEKIAIGSSKYIPSEHLPKLTASDWKQDYLYGLQRLGLDLMLNETEVK